MLLTRFAQTILYTQVLVFRTGLPRPGLLWNDNHVAQGFAASDEIVSLGVPDHDGQCLIEVHVDEPAAVLVETAEWAVQVPFAVTTGRVSVGTVGDMREIVLPTGPQQLVFAGQPNMTFEGATYAYLLRLAFTRHDAPGFGILKQGGEITSSTVLETTAERA